MILMLLWGIDAAAATSRTAASPSAKRARAATKVAAVKPAPATAAAKTQPAKKEAPRTLQDIHIEGEIPVPQVLFITARDQRRFLDLQHRRYLKTSQQVGEQTVLPSWIGVASPPPTDARKENPR
jgi:hypothetical protein